MFLARTILFGVGWDAPDGAPWERRSCSVHLGCFAVVAQRPVETVDPQAVAEWLAANVNRP